MLMVSTVTSYADSRNKAAPGQGYDCVVKVSTGGVYGTGVLLYGGQAILTAAHLFKNGSAPSTVTFETSAGVKTLTSSKATILPGYDASSLNNDLAIVWLNGHAPVTAQRYDIYRASDEIGQAMTFVGYGKPGTGAAGTSSSYSGAPIRQKASNTFDADASAFKAKAGAIMPWAPKPGTQLIADFDNGSSAQDALGRFLNLKHTGLGQSEGILSSGDSGGPAFIGGKVAGIAAWRSCAASWSKCWKPPGGWITRRRKCPMRNRNASARRSTGCSTATPGDTSCGQASARSTGLRWPITCARWSIPTSGKSFL